MIAYVKGSLENLETESVVVDVNGLGYRVFTPISEELMRLGVGSAVKLYTYMAVREDAMTLYGFLHKEDLEIFEKLITVTGVGPKLALQILSSVNASELALAIVREDKKVLTGISGIGAKTAARIILDLKDKIRAEASREDEGAVTVPVQQPAASGHVEETMLALISLGYTKGEAEKALKAVASAVKASGQGSMESLSTEELLRQSLKYLY